VELDDLLLWMSGFCGGIGELGVLQDHGVDLPYWAGGGGIKRGVTGVGKEEEN
jgi:hypothetical protein